jgi:antitoxin component YwqK of YwqJK toxin-antitoxin module
MAETGQLSCPSGTHVEQDGSVIPLEWWCAKADGVQHGPAFARYHGGRAKEVGMYVDGKRDGAWTHWQPDGQLAAKMHFRNGTPVGTWTSWFSDDAKWQQQTYVDGRREGMWIEWWPSGERKEQRMYRRGVAHGRSSWWSRRGKLVRTEDYRSGTLVETVRYIDGRRFAARD